ncbi:hypothetical protein GCM10010145_47310 [Streptomyces ruber]|uniref:Uncharacterized protein n=2 Tax=Streptomyces TaxID=1883 RepID=A0A918BIQ3_9ACTN|nr:hypothetical protein GCM10010145_47310 [Streptomyces ruber]
MDNVKFSQSFPWTPFPADAEEYPVALDSLANRKFITTEVNRPEPGTGLLRARSQTHAGWETLVLDYDKATQSWSLRSAANGKYVAVEKNFTGASQYALRARSDEVAGWERFHLWVNLYDHRLAFQSQLNDRFVTMEKNYTGTSEFMLRARSTDVNGSWETFSIYDLLDDQ